MLKIKTSKKLQNEYQQINKKFDEICYDWKKYKDEIIPQDKKFAKKIIKFIIGIIDYILKNYDKINVEEYKEFLSYYDYEFYYGPEADDNNYLSFDEISLDQLFWEMRENDAKLTKNELKKLRLKFIKALSMF